MDGRSVAERLTQLKVRIDAAAAAAGRPAGAVRLVAVSKLHAPERLIEAWDAGLRDFGENYAQEALAKIDAWPAARPVDWHFIGRLQSNKIKSIANRFAYVHSLDRLDLAERLDRATSARQNVFVQYNVANEASKGGLAEGEVTELTRRVAETCPRLRVCGLMVMPPPTEDPAAAGPHFRAARELLARLRARIPGHPLDQLSMGTSGDFEVAIREGATMVRIGTDVFGPRVKA